MRLGNFAVFNAFGKSGKGGEGGGRSEFGFRGSGIVGVWEGEDGESDVRLWEFETDSTGNWGKWVEIIGGW